jgi:hypothetical protein
LSTNGSSPPSLTDAELLDRWLQPAARRGPRYLQTDRTAAERFLAFAKKPRRQVTFKDLDAFMDDLAKRGGRPGELVVTRLRLMGLLLSLRWRATEIACTFCGGEGQLVRASVPSRNLEIFVCDECDAAWTGAEGFDAERCTTLPTIKEQYGLEADDFELLD